VTGKRTAGIATWTTGLSQWQVPDGSVAGILELVDGRSDYAGGTLADQAYGTDRLKIVPQLPPQKW
jgi:hypothetical protein